MSPRTTTAEGTLTLTCPASAEDCEPQSRSYRVRAEAGQTLSVSLSPADGRVVISDILDPNSTSLIPDADQDFWFEASVQTKVSGELQVIVSTTETATATNSYSLRLTVQ